MSGVSVARATAADGAALRALRLALWPDEDEAARADEVDALALLAREGGGGAIGFLEASLRRDHVNGTEASPVAFVEGVYVAPAWRRHGVARALVQAAAAWARDRGLPELASDAPLADAASHAFHRACGFAETERVVFFRQAL